MLPRHDRPHHSTGRDEVRPSLTPFGWALIGIGPTMLIAIAVVWVADKRALASCARQHNVYQCERVVTYVPVKEGAK